MSSKILISEIFGPTIQGEGPLVGTQTVFIRTAGCDYRCERCDSLSSVLPDLINKHAELMEPEEIAEKVLSLCANGCTNLTISGGNPCMWERMHAVIDAIHKENQYIQVCLETQGTIIPTWLSKCSHVTISPKAFGMGADFELDKFESFYHSVVIAGIPSYCIKIVVFIPADLELVVDLIDKYPSMRRIMFVSIGNHNPPYPAKRDNSNTITKGEFVEDILEHTKMFAELILNDPRLHGVRVFPQLHTLIWGNEKGH